MAFSGALRRAALAGALLAACILPGAAQQSSASFEDASRIAAIGGSITEIIFALGQEKRLIARDSTSVYPEAAMALPDVGYMRALSPEGVLSVNPSGILALEGSGPREALDVLSRASVPMIMVPETFDLAGILQKIRIVGAAVGEPEKAALLAAQVEKELAAAERLTAGIVERKRVLFILSSQGGKLLAAGSGTAADGIIAMAGGINAVEGFAGYKHLSDEAAILAAPDIILMMDRGDAVDADEVLALPAIAQTPAGQARRLVYMDAGYLLGFGPRTASAILDLSVAFYGDEIRG